MFAGTVLFVLAGFALIWGIVGLLRLSMFQVMSSGLGITWNYTVWSWIFIGLAILTALTALAVYARVGVARYVGVFLAAVIAFAAFLTLPALSLWSLIMIGVALLAIHSLATRRDETTTR